MNELEAMRTDIYQGQFNGEHWEYVTDPTVVQQVAKNVGCEDEGYKVFWVDSDMEVWGAKVSRPKRGTKIYQVF